MRTGQLALPYYLPLSQSDLKLLHALHPRCLDCRTQPPANWSVAQVVSQVEEAGMQGRRDASAVGAAFARARVDGTALMSLDERRRRRWRNPPSLSCETAP